MFLLPPSNPDNVSTNPPSTPPVFPDDLEDDGAFENPSAAAISLLTAEGSSPNACAAADIPACPAGDANVDNCVGLNIPESIPNLPLNSPIMVARSDSAALLETLFHAPLFLPGNDPTPQNSGDRMSSEL